MILIKFKDFSKLNNKKINLINVDYDFKKCFEKITSKSNKYIDESFSNCFGYYKKKQFSQIY